MKIKFVTLNIWDGGRLFDNIVDFIRRESPDILALQEVYDGKDSRLEKRFRTVSALREELGLEHFVFSPAFKEIFPFGNIEQGNAVFAKFPIKKIKDTFFDIPYGLMERDKVLDPSHLPKLLQHVIVKIGKLDINLLNVHGIWGIDGKDNERRLKMSKIIVDKIENKDNVILTGDTNVLPNTTTVGNIEKYLENVFKDELTSTFNMKRKTNGNYATAVVDMIFTSRNIKVLEHYCPNVDVSDHLPLVCVFDL